MKSLVTAGLASALAPGIPAEIVYLPEGENSISATVNGSPKAVNVRVPRDRGIEIAARFQANLVQLQGENVRPHFGFDHKAGPASALPKSFRYEPGVGVMASVEWTGAGRTAIEGKDFSYFSPTFLLGDDGVPDGLPSKGEIGSLTNSPAFRGIQRIAASDASLALVRGSATAQLEILGQQLVAAGQAESLNEGVSLAVAQNPELYRLSCAEGVRKETIREIDDMRSNTQPSARTQLDEIADAIYLRGEAATELDAKILAAERNPQLYQDSQDASKAALQVEPGVRGRVSSTHAAEAGSFEARARALVSAGQVASLEDAFQFVAASDPNAYQQYLETLS